MELQYLFLAVILLIAAFTYGKQIRRRLKSREIIDRSIALLSERLGPPLPDYVMEEKLYGSYLEHFREDEALTVAATDILRHCGLSDCRVRVHGEEELSPQVAGNYHSAGGFGIIHLRIDRYTRPEVALAVLIHECMHYFLHQKGIGFPETFENEVLTDTAMIYLGFFPYIDRGYINVGYISYDAILRIRKKLEEGNH